MITQNQIMADFKSDIYSIVLPDTWMCFLMGEYAERDTPMRIYQYSTASTAADDGETVIKPTSIVGAGRWLKYYYQQYQANWTQSNSSALDYITNKPNLATIATSGAYSDLSGKPSLAIVATSGLYTDLLSKPTLATVATSGNYTDLINTPSARSQSSSSRTLNSAAYQIAVTRDSTVYYSAQIAATMSLSGGQTGTVALQISSTSGGTYITIATLTNGNTGTLTIGLNITQTQAAVLTGFIPAGYYVKIVSTGTATNTLVSQQEVLL